MRVMFACSMNNTKLIYGLGNPDTEDERSRHNIGCMAIDTFLNRDDEEGANWVQDKEKEVSVISQRKGDLHLVFCKPLRYMNDQGICLKRMIDALNIDLERDVLIAHDDLDLPLGKLKLRQRGLPPSHNGLRSIKEVMRSELFWKLRIGIETRSNRQLISGKDFVLADFTDSELRIVNFTLEQAKKVFSLFIKEDFNNGSYIANQINID